MTVIVNDNLLLAYYPIVCNLSKKDQSEVALTHREGCDMTALIIKK